MYTKLDTRHAEERLRLSYFKTLDVHNNKYTILLWYRVAICPVCELYRVQKADQVVRYVHQLDHFTLLHLLYNLQQHKEYNLIKESRL